MQIIAPDYYTEFKCIADKCKHSCCIGWEIDIDPETTEIYKNIPGELGQKLKKNIEFSGTPHFITDKNDRCPFLNESGLCDIITSLGEEGLCQICYDHPRFRNYFSGRTEIGLGLCCEAAAKLILSKKNKVALKVLEADSEAETLTDKEKDLLALRDKIISAFQNRALPLNKRMEQAAELTGIKMPKFTPKELAGLYRSLERLDPKWDEYLNALEVAERLSPTPPDSLIIPTEQLLIYLAYRHLADALEDGNIKGRMNFILQSAAICIMLLNAVLGSNAGMETFAEICRMYSAEIEYSEENIYRLTH